MSTPLAKAVRALTVSPLAGYHTRERYRQVEGIGERIQEVSVLVSGTASSKPAWMNQEIDFPDPFYDAPGQRDSNFETPVFCSGIVGRWDVFIAANVETWVRSEEEWFTGAILRIGIFSPGGKSSGSAEVHCRFTGYAGPSEDSEGE